MKQISEEQLFPLLKPLSMRMEDDNQIWDTLRDCRCEEIEQENKRYREGLDYLLRLAKTQDNCYFEEAVLSIKRGEEEVKG